MPQHLRSTHVFIVDDDPVVRNTLSLGLTEQGFTVSAFEDGARALEAWRNAPPDVAVVDISLPDMTGAELTSRLHALESRPVIALSRHHDSDRVQAAIQAGVVSYLVKPVTAIQLRPPLDAAIARAHEAPVADAASLSESQLDILLSQFGFGVAIIDRSGTVLRTNEAAERTLAQGDLLQLQNKRMVSVQPQDQDAFENFMANLNRPPEEIEAQVLALGRSTPGRHLQVWGSTLQSGVEELNGSSPFAVILLADPDEEIPLPAHVLKSLYSLTATEARLAEALVNGLSVEQFAKRSKTSYNTARSHLKSIFVKTRTNRQVDLVRLLSKLLSSLNA